MDKTEVNITLNEVQRLRAVQREKLSILDQALAQAAARANALASTGVWRQETIVRPRRGSVRPVTLRGTELIPLNDQCSVAVRQFWHEQRQETLTGLFLQNTPAEPATADLVATFNLNSAEITDLGRPDEDQLDWLAGWLDYIEENSTSA